MNGICVLLEAYNLALNEPILIMLVCFDRGEIIFLMYIFYKLLKMERHKLIEINK
jgi:hypothetical protein